jgi:alpha-L-fucosidase
MIKKTVLFIIILSSALWGQQAEKKEAYLYPTDPLVQKKLEVWQDLKFGLLMHWGLYAQLGIVESWALCSEDQSFQDRGGVCYTEFKEMYFSQIRKFNPQQFDPEPWARAAKDAGMRYVVFTTKHHDGFCMWDTRQTDFRITGPESPFGNHPRSNVTKEIFKAFRDEGLMIGTYFSKADWHHPDYWSPLWATPDRNNNYDVRKYPEMWQRFKDFTYNQIEELMTTLGSVDVLWLDGGWVRPDSTITDEVLSWGYDIPKWEQDIDMPRIAKMARSHQPGLLIVDRTVHGPYENYRTPEQHVPARGLAYPFETNMTITGNWGHVPNARYKTANKLIHTLVDVVAKGGNFILNVGPTPQGTFESTAYERLKEIGQWMKINNEAIYATRKWRTYHEGDDIRFTRTKDGKTVYVFAMTWPGTAFQSVSLIAKPGTPIVMLGDYRPLEWFQGKGGLWIELPEGLKGKGEHVWVFRIEIEEDN